MGVTARGARRKAAPLAKAAPPPIVHHTATGRPIPRARVSSRIPLRLVREVVEAAQRRFDTSPKCDATLLSRSGEEDAELLLLSVPGAIEAGPCGPWSVAVRALLAKVQREDLGCAEGILGDGDATRFCVVAVRPAQQAVVGFCVCSEVPVAVRAAGDSAGGPLALGDVRCRGCICGVHLIWTCPTARRQGVARALIDCARQHLVFGYPIPAEHVAFSHPTTDGRELAQTYAGRPDFLVIV